MKHISIIGATGILGSATAKFFIQQHFRVKCFVRNIDKAKELEKAGAELVVGNLTAEVSLKEACRDVDVVITAAHALLGKGKNSSMNVDNKAHKALIDFAVKENVTHFIYASVHGASPNHPIDFLRNKYAVEQYLINSNLRYTILRLPAFMEWHVHNLLGKSILEKNKVMILGQGDNPINFIAVDDIVQALGKIAGNKNYYNKIINIAGPENLSRNEVAAIYAKLLHTTPKIGHVPVGALRILSKIINPFHPGIARVMKFSVYTDSSDETMNTNESIRQFGLKPTSVGEFIKNKVHPK
jgi:uncharacterized protein YbjT (DUF2867 family)